MKELYEAAGGRQLGYKKLVSLAKKPPAVRPQLLSAWMAADSDRGPDAPRTEYTEYIVLLTNHLEKLAADRNPAHHRRSEDGWMQLLREARKEGADSRGGRPRKASATNSLQAQKPEFVLPQHRDLVRTLLPPEGVVDREVELAELAAFATDRGSEAHRYAWWQARPWAGKSALLSWFVLEKRPADVDVVGYFIARRFDNNDRTSFLDSVNRQLATVAGQKISALRRRTPELFHELLRAAAAAAGSRGRMLLLAVDGLDEDEGTRLGGDSIAALLPPNPPPHLRVVVTSRPNPGVPNDVGIGHPLRNRSMVRQLSPVTAATAARDTAVDELARLLDDRPVGIGIVGLLAAARGGLRAPDLAELLKQYRYDVDKRLRSITGRSLVIDRTVFSSDPAYVLGHEELLQAAAHQLGDLAQYEEMLCNWADTYHRLGWPETTPPFLLHHNIRLLQRTGDAAHQTAFALDARRQQRLLATAGADIALGDLDRATDAVTGDSPADLEILAVAAASRDLVSVAARPMPRDIPRAFARLGDLSRARILALASPDPVGKAYALADITRTLVASGNKEAQSKAVEWAEEAERWMLTALRQADPRHGGIDEAEGAAEVACALIESGRQEAAAALLKEASCEAWDFIDAATVCLPYDPKVAGKLLDEAEQRAERTHSRHADPNDPERAVRVWLEILRADPDRVERVCDLIHAHGTAQAADPGHRAAASTALAPYRPEAAAALAEQARAEVAAILQARRRSDYDPTFPYTLDLVTQALTGAGRPADAENLRADVPQEALTDPVEFDFDMADWDFGITESDHTSSAAHPAKEAIELADQGRTQEAWERLEVALRRHAAGANRSGGSRVRWLVLLAGALAADGNADTDEDADLIAGFLDDPTDRVRTYVSASLSSAATGRCSSALLLARKAAQAVETLPESAIAERVLVAQALAHAGDAHAAVEALSRAGTTGPGGAHSSHQRRELNRGRLAVLGGLRHHTPAAVARHIDKRREKIIAGSGHDGEILLPALAKLLPLVPDSEPECRTQILTALHHAGPPLSEPPDHWSPESLLVWALLQPTNSRLSMSSLYEWNDDPFESSLASLALVRAVLGNLPQALRIAERIALPSLRADTYAAVASHLARVPAHLPTTYERVTSGTQMSLVRALALACLPDHHVPGEKEARMRDARSFVCRALTTGDGWYQALPALAYLAPAAVRRIRGLAFTHLGHLSG
ncbi:hypothetical protein AB0932_30130 [Streptomyces sp. NPDC006682]|uniref:hypothetical protein n=1 Tax=unclassified Streptomyces TaxID=2593676 RepID=UPI0034563DF8